MIYTCETTISQPRARVIELLEDPENLQKWQPGLLEFRNLSGTHGQTGAKSRLRQQMGNRVIEMTETVALREGLDRYNAIYEAKGVWNRVDNTFTETVEGHTHWHIETEFRCTGIVWLMSKLMPGMFRRETEKFMKNFKNFAEAA